MLLPGMLQTSISRPVSQEVLFPVLCNSIDGTVKMVEDGANGDTGSFRPVLKLLLSMQIV